MSEGIIERHAGDVPLLVGRLGSGAGTLVAEVDVFCLLFVAAMGGALGDNKLETVSLVEGDRLRELVPQASVRTSKATTRGGKGTLASLDNVRRVRIDKNVATGWVRPHPL